jgi:hypothetical protein
MALSLALHGSLEVSMRRASFSVSSTLKSFLRNYAAAILSIIAAIVLLFAASCGGRSMMMTSRQLQSIMVTPQSADARASNGMVQFSAMGNFNMAPMTASTPVQWSLGSPFSAQAMPQGVSINANGLAQCSGFVGMVTVIATAPMDPTMSMSQMSMNSMNVTGTAQLTCP